MINGRRIGGYIPLWSNISHSPDIRPCRQHKLVENNPIRRCIQPTRRVQRNDLRSHERVNEGMIKSSCETYLVIFDRQVITFLPFFMRDLHEKSTDKRLPHIKPKLFLVLYRNELDFKPLHRALKLGPNVVGLRQCTSRKII